MLTSVPELMFGSVDDAFNLPLLQESGVTHILNVANELNFSERVGFHYRKIGIDDDSLTSNIQSILPTALSHIHEVREKGG
jgi:hypothetical protein